MTRRLDPLVVAIALQAVLSVCGVAWVVAQEPPALTELDRLRLQVVALQRALSREQAENDGCRAVLGPLRATANTQAVEQAEAAAVAAIEAAHPGFTLDRRTGSLVAKPEPPAKDEP